MNDFLSQLQALADPVREDVLRAPFGYPGGKSRLSKRINEILPYRGSYIEPFGGSGAVLLGRRPSKLDVYNDRYGGVVAFYRCLKSDTKYQDLAALLQLSIHSREEWVFCKETWEHDALNDVERAYRWIYMHAYSFGQLARNFGRTTAGSGCLSGKLRERANEFHALHQRLKRVQIENQDWHQCCTDYEHPEAVFYCDPPYLECAPGIYTGGFTHADHIRLIEWAFSTPAYVAISSYPNKLYDAQDWDDVIELGELHLSLKSLAYTVTNSKEALRGLETRGTSREVLYIKDN